MVSSRNGDTPSKTCFVIAPIGELGSPTRSRSDKVLRHIITPAATECGYGVIRSDRESQPGMIGSQVINHLIDDELVIADLTDHNPNVFYELAIRHVVRKPIVQIIQAGQRLPFDVIQSRTIFVDHTDLDSAADCRDQLVRQIRAVEKDPTDVDNPITQAVKLKALDQSIDPEEKRDAQIMTMLQELTVRVNMLTEHEVNLGSGEEFPRAGFFYGGNWHTQDITSVSQINNFLLKSETYRSLSNDARKVVRRRCHEILKHRKAISRVEIAIALESFIILDEKANLYKPDDNIAALDEVADE